MKKGLKMILVLMIVFSGPVSAQNGEVNPDDFATIDAIMTATYRSISGPVGQARELDTFRNLFWPDARLISVNRAPDGTSTPIIMTPENYLERSGAFLVESGFTESEIARRIDRYGDIAQVFSTYEGTFANNRQPSTIRGINSFQLMWDGSRWWVMTIFWQQEGTHNPLPDSYKPADENE